MAVTTEHAASGTRREPIVNDFSIQVATVNGSGSQSANNVLMRSIFQMGVPVSGKNLFPSNIAGLPTWFTIRASERGYIARRAHSEIFIAMNPDTIAEDVEKLQAGSTLIYNSDLKYQPTREDVQIYGIPFGKIAAECCQEVKLRKMVTNMVYVGVAAELLNIDMAEVENAIAKQFKGKAKAVDLNVGAARAGFEYAKANLANKPPYRIVRSDKTQGKIILDGNQAAAIGCLFAGCTVVAWYPITPSSSLAESLIGLLEKYRIDKETGQATFAVVQAEDELASAGMVMGAGWAGARAMTCTAGPGISLMSEFIGLGYFTEIPGVFFDVQRVGPSTGLPTRTKQGDVLSLYTLSHDDTKHPVLIPCSPEEAYEFSLTAFDLAERLQTPIWVMLDLDLGMNNWMADPFKYPEGGWDRGKVLSAEELEKAGGFARYRDVDGDGIPYRTLPGTPHPLAAYFTRGSGHNDKAQYSERPEDYLYLMDRLAKKHDTARTLVPKPVQDWKGAEVTIIAYGTSDFAVEEARDALREQGVETNYLRLRALPFTGVAKEVIAKSQRVYVVDQNRDAQMADLLRLEVGCPDAGKIRSILHYDGLPLDALTVINGILEGEKK